jgi:signal transduction histidine kinase
MELEPLLEQSLAANEGFAEQHGVKLVIHGCQAPVRVCVDSDRLIQVVTNLLSNAIKFSLPGSAVQVALRTQCGTRPGGDQRQRPRHSG